MRALLALILLAAALCHPARADDVGDYGPDWPVCRNLDADPQVEITACNRLIDGGALSKKHLSWAYNNRGTAWNDLRRQDLAWTDFQKSIEIDATNHAPYYNLAALYYQAGRFDEALEQYDKAAALAPRLDGVKCRRGKALQALRRVGEAISAFEEALRDVPGDVCSIGNLVKVYNDDHRYAETLAMLDRGIEATGGSSQLYGWRAETHRWMREPEQAIDDLSRGLALNPNNYDNLRDRGMFLSQLGRYDAALEDLNRAVALAPDWYDGYFWRANAELRSGSYEAAFKDCGHALTLWSDDTGCKLVALRSAFLVGDFAAAARFADDLPVEFFRNAPLYRGVAEFASGDIGAAATTLGVYTAAEPDDLYGWLWLHLINRRMGREAPAEVKALAMRRDAWPTPVLRRIVGSATDDEVLAAAEVPDPDIRRQRIAEANYYLGELAAIDGDEAKSAAYLKASRAVAYAEIDALNFVPVYKDNNAMELGLAAAALGGGL